MMTHASSLRRHQLLVGSNRGGWLGSQRADGVANRVAYEMNRADDNTMSGKPWACGFGGAWSIRLRIGLVHQAAMQATQG